MKPSILVVDTSAFIFRAFYSVPEMNDTNNTPINAVYGFFSMILNLIKYSKCNYIIFALDSKEKTFRDEIHTQYKANRIECPPALVPQFSIIQEGLNAACFAQNKVVGIEADDIIASIAISNHFKDFKKLICSKDKDLMQLIKNDEVEFYDTKTNDTIKEEDVFTKFGVQPQYISDYLALVGDASDNIPGAKNIGPKKASVLITKLQNIENIYSYIDGDKADNLIDSKTIELLQQSRQNVLMSKQLTHLTQRDMVFCDTQNCHIDNINCEALKAFLQKYSITALSNKIDNLFKNNTMQKETEISPKIQKQAKLKASFQNELF